jgi:membrane-bound lytic murein transglycosylase B
LRQRAVQVTRTPAFGIAVLAPLVLAGAVGAGAPTSFPEVRDTAVTPLAAVAPAPRDPAAGASIVTVERPPVSFHMAAASVSAPPPAVVVSSPGALRIPAMALSAYRNAEMMMARSYPDCGVSWNLLAGIGRIESMHANGGATDANGTAVRPIYGPALDGTLPGNEVIVQGSQAGRVSYARAMGPMQFLPGTWSRYASDGDGDGKADPQNLYDSALAAARYLCSGGLNLRDPSQVTTAILRYNNSMPYARNVLGWAASYATGVVPVDLPPISGPIPPMGDSHLDNPEGLGPGAPLNATGLPPTDPLAQLPLLDFTQTDVANRLPTSPLTPGGGPLPGPVAEGAQAPQAEASCTIICNGPQSPPPASPQLPPEALPPGIAPPPPDAAPVQAPPAAGVASLPWLSPPADSAVPAPTPAVVGPLPGPTG